MAKAYYNEIDLYCAEWLHNLQKENLIAPGDIDTRPIQDVCPNDLKGYSQHHFFAGIGGWSRALRLSNWPDHREVWTGSCPCQPFSLAGKRGGFADDRHLWPYFRYLIAVGRPPVVFGEQVASASEWLGLVRSDLEAMDYAVGAMPVEAASAGADHLRDRYWFVGHDQSDGWSEGRTEYVLRGGTGFNGSMADPAGARSFSGAQSGIHRGEKSTGTWHVEFERHSGAGVANADFSGESEGWKQRSGQLGRAGSDSQTCGSGNLPDAASERAGKQQGLRPQTGQVDSAESIGRCGSSEFSWVLGADGKARRVKPGIRLLADGIPNRVGKLRGFGNAIDPRPAAAFIQSVMDAIDPRNPSY